MSWTDERIDRLKSLWTQGMTASQIADELGQVSRNAVIGKAHRLGLQSRPSPVKPNEAPAAEAVAKPAVEAPAPKPLAAAPPPPPVVEVAAPPVAPAPVADEEAEDEDEDDEIEERVV